jgi:hypothetical protein
MLAEGLARSGIEADTCIHLTTQPAGGCSQDAVCAASGENPGEPIAIDVIGGPAKTELRTRTQAGALLRCSFTFLPDVSIHGHPARGAVVRVIRS